MITFKSQADLGKLPQGHPAYPVIKELIELLIDDFPIQPYSADYGFIALAELGDESRVLTELDMPWTLAEIPWEGASLRQGFFVSIFVGTDDFALAIVIPDEPWVDGELREVLTEILDTTPQGANV